MRATKLIAAVIGVLMLIGSAGMVAAGAVGLAVTDAAGWVDAGPVRITTDAAAVVGDDIDVDLGGAIGDQTFIGIGDVATHFDVTSRNGKEVFIAIGPARDVNRYLEGVGHDRVDVFRNDGVQLEPNAGRAALNDPAAQTFWVASSSTGAIDWDLTTGEWAIVVANADGSPGLDVAVTGAARIPFARAIAVGLIIVGVLGLAGGATVTYFGVRQSPKPPAPTSDAPGFASREVAVG